MYIGRAEKHNGVSVYNGLRGVVTKVPVRRGGTVQVEVYDDAGYGCGCVVSMSSCVRGVGTHEALHNNDGLTMQRNTTALVRLVRTGCRARRTSTWRQLAQPSSPALAASC